MKTLRRISVGLIAIPLVAIISFAALTFQRYFFTALAFGGLAIAVPQLLGGRIGLKGTDTR